jgi:rhodanese-related sulfurtransferase
MSLALVLEFIGNHPILIMTWLAFLFAVMFSESLRGGKKLTTTETIFKINKEDAVILDIRKRDEFSEGHITDAINVPFEKLNDSLKELEKYKARPIIVVCKTGTTAGSAVAALTKAEFSEVFRLNGGMMDWNAQKLLTIK